MNGEEAHYILPCFILDYLTQQNDPLQPWLQYPFLYFLITIITPHKNSLFVYVHHQTYSLQSDTTYSFLTQEGMYFIAG